MLPHKEKKKIWEKVCKTFPNDHMMRDLHFIRELMSALRKNERVNYKDLGLLVREEFTNWLKSHPDIDYP